MEEKNGWNPKFDLVKFDMKLVKLLEFCVLGVLVCPF